jgi:Peptidase family M1 domain/Peptidase M1 N-terminal domain/Immune inhibitor A peptidase M6
VERRRATVALSLALACLAALPAAAAQGPTFTPGAPGIGDPYFPRDGNGGYDVRHYLLDLRYQPQTDTLAGVATIRARATQNLSRFNLDLVGLEVRDIEVDGHPAQWRRRHRELMVTPRQGIPKRAVFTVEIAYDGVPETLGNPPEPRSQLGFIHTDDGMIAVGQLHAAPTWYPVNDHPRDKAAYTFRLTVPAGLEAVANGVLADRDSGGGWDTWTWKAGEPMAPYLVTATVGEYDLRAYRAGGIRYWDAFDPDLFNETAAPRTGTQYAISQRGDIAYKRLARTIDVPANGARMSFWVTRDAESFDHLFVEAHTVGADDWTTLRDLHGHTRRKNPGCPYWLQLHPFLTHYQTDDGDGTCSPQGTTGRWWSAGGQSDGYEQWEVDLSPYAGRRIELSITYATDDIVNLDGVFVDDIVVSNGPGSTSFEDDGDTLDGWRVPGPPPGSPPSEADWMVGTADAAPPTLGEVADGALDRQPEVVEFLEGVFGPYPFRVGGGIVDDTDAFAFALETQTRPVYSTVFFDHPLKPPDEVVVHELAHQWAGDSVTPALWQHIWLSEGFATYAEWLWSDHLGRETAQEIYESVLARPADDPFWSVVIGDPGVEALFDSAVYARGAATLHALRLEIGDADFFDLLHRWTREHAGGNVATPQFIALAERVSGRNLDAFFDEWLFTGEKPGDS